MFWCYITNWSRDDDDIYHSCCTSRHHIVLILVKKNLWNPCTLARAAVSGESIGFVEGFLTGPTGEPVVNDESCFLQVSSGG